MNFKKISISFFATAFSIALVLLTGYVSTHQTPTVHAQATPGNTITLGGYIWSSNIGWISLNAANFGRNNYGVIVDTHGNLSNYGWSSNVGWISFNYLGDGSSSDTSTCGQRAYYDGTKFTGFARFVRPLSSGISGWDGCVKLSSASYGVTASTTNPTYLDNYSWGSTVVGWMHWNAATITGGPGCTQDSQCTPGVCVTSTGICGCSSNSQCSSESCNLTTHSCNPCANPDANGVCPGPLTYAYLTATPDSCHTPLSVQLSVKTDATSGTVTFYRRNGGTITTVGSKSFDSSYNGIIGLAPTPPDTSNLSDNTTYTYYAVVTSGSQTKTTSDAPATIDSKICTPPDGGGAGATFKVTPTVIKVGAGSMCHLVWNFTTVPTGSTCTITGAGVNYSLNDSDGNVQQSGDKPSKEFSNPNTDIGGHPYTLKCTGGDTSVSITKFCNVQNVSEF